MDWVGLDWMLGIPEVNGHTMSYLGTYISIWKRGRGERRERTGRKEGERERGGERRGEGRRRSYYLPCTIVPGMCSSLFASSNNCPSLSKNLARSVSMEFRGDTTK